MVMLTIWKSLIQCKLDYCSQLWCPTDQASISRLESVARHFTAQVAGLEDHDYWERLKALRMYSQERRRERYRIIFIWKVLQGSVQGYNIQCMQSPSRGRLVEVAQHHREAPAAVRRAREASLSKVLSCSILSLGTSGTWKLAPLTNSRQSQTHGWRMFLTNQLQLGMVEQLSPTAYCISSHCFC